MLKVNNTNDQRSEKLNFWFGIVNNPKKNFKGRSSGDFVGCQFKNSMFGFQADSMP